MSQEWYPTQHLDTLRGPRDPQRTSLPTTAKDRYSYLPGRVMALTWPASSGVLIARWGGRAGCASRPYRAGGSFGMTTHELPTGASVRHLSGPSIWKPDPRSLLALPATLLAPPLCGMGSWRSIGRILRLGAWELHHAVCINRPLSKRAPP